MSAKPKAVPKAKKIDKQFLKALADSVIVLIEELKKEPKSPRRLTFPHKYWHIMTVGKYTIKFRRRGTIDAMKALRRIFRRQDWRTKWSDDHIENAELSFMEDAFDHQTTDGANTAASRAAASLDAEPPEYVVVLPIGRLYLGPMKFTIPNVKIRTITKRRLAQIRKAFYEIINTTPHTDSEKKRLREDVVGLTTLLLNRPCAEVIERGDQAKAYINAVRDVEPLLDYFQLMAAIFEPVDRRIRIHLGGDLLTEQPQPIIIATDRSNIHHRGKLLFDFRLEVTPERVTRMKTAGFDALVRSLGKSEADCTDFERTMQRSMHWIADANRQDQRENRITSYITSIEMFFSASGAPISRDVAEGCAFVLGTTLKSRTKIADEMSALYSLRNSVSHGGKKIDDENTEDRLHFYAVNLLAKASKMSSEFETVKELREWIKNRRLGP